MEERREREHTLVEVNVCTQILVFLKLVDEVLKFSPIKREREKVNKSNNKNGQLTSIQKMGKEKLTLP
jgi:hypothetical protein